MNRVINNIIQLFNKVKNDNPAVYQLASHLILTDTTNALLSIGAKPVATHCKEELEEVVSKCNSLILNTCNIDGFLIDAMKQALRIADETKKPVVLDASGVGDSNFRRYTCFKLLEAGEISALRANPYEIMVLDGESQHENVTASDCVPHAQNLCIKYNINCLIPGKIDYIVSSQKGIAINNGVDISRHLFSATAMLSSICAAFLGVSDSKLDALASACSVYRIACEIAVIKGAVGPGTFHSYIFDALYNLNAKDIENRLQISEF
jgi:hydroxyethylthiazole kinase